MIRGKIIRQFLTDGTPEGRWCSELSNWTGLAYKIPRTYVNHCEDRPDLHNTGVYFLFGQSEDGDLPQAYIGEAENLLERLKQHLAGKDFWTESVAFVSKDNNLNKAHVKYLEHRLYRLAQQAGRCALTNGNVPAAPSISEMDREEMEEFLDNLRLVLGVLGHKVLEPPGGGILPGHLPVFSLTTREGVVAKGKPVSDGFVVFKGAQIAPRVSNALQQQTSIVNKRQLLIEKGMVDDNFRLAQDWTFSSPSLAACIVLGHNANGRTVWKEANGRSLKAMEEQGEM